MSTTMRVKFLPDGSVKLTVDGEVPTEIHDAVAADIDKLTLALGGPVRVEGGHKHSVGRLVQTIRIKR